MLELEDIKRLHDKAYNSGQVTRERASDDMVFAFVTQWDDNSLAWSQNSFRGEFNILKKATRQIISDLAANPVQVDFEPIDETREDAAELIDGLYRTDDNNNVAVEAYANAKQETVVCGVGAWLLHTKYVSARSGDKNQVIRRKPIFEANNCVFWDPNAKLLDKSDAKYVSVLTAYSEDGYKDLVQELTGEEIEHVNAESFKHPEHSYTFPWIGGEGKKIYVVKFYHITKVKEKILTMRDPFGQVVTLKESELDKIMDDMLDAGFSIIDEKKTECNQVTEYIASGEMILSSNVIAGEHIPVVPMYGEHAFIEGEEHYEGVTRLAKDPQRLRNFQLSYLADITAQSPREKPIFLQEQIAGFEEYYSLSGADNNYPYLLQNRKAGDGSDLPIGPIGMLPAPNIPPALAAMIDVTRQAVEDVANPGIPQDIADPDLSGKAVLALQNRLDMQSMVYQEHYKHAKRRDAEIYASIASVIYDVPRKAKMTLPDGTTKEVEIMQTVPDKETGDIVTLHDLRNAEFEVYSKIGASYSTQKEQTIDRLAEMRANIAQYDPATAKILMLKELELMEGVNFDDIRDYANNQLILSGIKKPETPEEEQLLAQAQQNQQPDANMVLAMAEDKKGQAALLREQREGIDMQLKAENETMKRQIDAFKAQTGRMEMQVDAQKAGAEIENKRTDTLGKQIENSAKIVQLRVKDMSDEELFRQVMEG